MTAPRTTGVRGVADGAHERDTVIDEHLPRDTGEWQYVPELVAGTVTTDEIDFAG